MAARSSLVRRGDRGGRAHCRQERGVALLAAVMALALIGVLVAGAFFASSLEQRTAHNVVAAAAARAAAEAGLDDVIANARAGDFPFGLADSVTYAADVGPAGWPASTSYSVWVFPLNPALYLVKSRGTSRGITSTLAELTKPAAASAPIAAALTVGAPVTFTGGAFRIDGNNADPAGGTGCPGVPLPAQLFALRSQSGSGVTPETWPNLLGIAGPGAPAGQGSALADDPTVGPLLSALFATGGTYDQLRAVATWALPAGTYVARQPSTIQVEGTARCNVADDRNWGEPRSGTGATPECRTHLPVVLGTSGFGSPFVVAGGRGQGVLLADGDLVLTDGFEWTGLILVKGSFSIIGAGATVQGAVVAQNGGTPPGNVLGDNATIAYSSCAVARALSAVAPLRPIAMRPWTQLF
ncbi:MAG TPA: hypothetical protein VFS33_11670 [Gemmatimonadales bacterium]|nr:hypothetical protein [Gemmatimonadales bacterium]